jgi:hypothetical protein
VLGVLAFGFWPLAIDTIPERLLAVQDMPCTYGWIPRIFHLLINQLADLLIIFSVFFSSIKYSIA